MCIKMQEQLKKSMGRKKKIKGLYLNDETGSPSNWYLTNQNITLWVFLNEYTYFIIIITF